MKRTEIAVGAVILGGIMLLFFGTLWLKGARLGEDETTITARFLEIGQLLEGNDVKLRGVSIGRVERIELEPGGGGVLVSMRIDSEVPLPADPMISKTAMRPRSFPQLRKRLSFIIPPVISLFEDGAACSAPTTLYRLALLRLLFTSLAFRCRRSALLMPDTPFPPSLEC